MNGRRPQSNGFTLIELLVVIAIIAILVAILFPVIAKMKAKGNQASCASNLKEIMTALLQYKEDCSGWIPYPYVKSGTSYNYTWRHAVSRYTKSQNIFTCPSNRNVRSYVYDTANQPSIPLDVPKSGYGMWKGMEPPGAGNVFFPVDTNTWATSAEGILIGENKGSSVFTVEPSETRAEMKPRYDHMNGMIVAYGDGHASWYQKDSANLRPAAFGKFGWSEHMMNY